jgi:HK97 family phage major capsid protein
VLQLQRNNFPATGIILPPFNWANIELTKDNDDRYIFARPQDSAVPRMWGLPVVSTNALNEGTGHVGNYQVGPSVYDRMMSAVEMSTENDTDFQSLMVTFRIYARLTLAIEYPKALIDLDDLTDGPSGGS